MKAVQVSGAVVEFGLGSCSHRQPPRPLLLARSTALRNKSGRNRKVLSGHDAEFRNENRPRLEAH